MIINGKPVSNGIAISNVYKLHEDKIDIIDEFITNTELEIKNFHNALEFSSSELDILIEKASKMCELKGLDIFKSHKLIINDPVIIKEVEELILKKKISSASAYKNIIEKHISNFNSMDNTYISERSIDIKDVSNRVLGKLIDKNLEYNLIMTKKVILVLDEITPSLVLSINTNLVKGIILKKGGITTHSSIMIKNLGIPLIIGVGNEINNIIDGELIIMDGEKGSIISSPNNLEIDKYVLLQKKHKKERVLLSKYMDKETKTKDGFKVELLANINNDSEVEIALENGAEGIGLFRTEFAYLNALEFPKEEELISSYKKVLNAYPNKNVIIRTIDIGGDKIPKHLVFKDQDTLRGLPLALSNIDVLKTQIKALLQANTHGNLSIMFPMVNSLVRLKEAVQLVYNSHYELTDNDIKVNVKYRLGIMVEEKEVVDEISSYAQVVDFFSIGSNDLLQSISDIDRDNSKDSNSKKYLESDFLNTLKEIISASHDEGITTSICGEMASDLEAVIELVKMGIDSLSINPKNTLKTRELISTITLKK